MSHLLTPEHGLHALLITLGAVCCFFGWSFLKIGLTVYSFLAGITGGLLLVSYLPLANLWITWSAALIAGLIAVYLIFKVFRLALFINGVILGILLYAVLIPSNDDSVINTITIAVSGLLGGIIFLLIHKSVMILLTALAGAFLIVYGSAAFWGRPYLTDLLLSASLQETIHTLYTLWGITLLSITTTLLAMTGVLCQYSLHTGKSNKS